MTKIRAMDPDDVFAYQTIKLVSIRDRRLGIIHHLLQFGIFIYIVVYTIVIQKRYLRAEVPNGAFRSTVREPSFWPEANSLPYCLQNQPIYNQHANYNCTYMLGLDLTYPPAMMDSILVSTRIKDTFFNITQNTNNNNCASINLPFSAACAPTARESASNRYYLAAIENYTIFIEHAVFGRQNKITVTNRDSNGKLRFKDKKREVIRFTEDDREGDIFSIQTLLEAADVHSLDQPSGQAGGGSFRYDGVLLMVIVEYYNTYRDNDKLHYTYTVYRIPNVNVIAQQPSQSVPGGYTQRSWYGIRVIFAVSGSVGKFDFPTLLTALVSGAVLVKVAATVVDLLLLYIMPDKLLYRKHKFEVTDDFSDVRELKEKEKSQAQLSE